MSASAPSFKGRSFLKFLAVFILLTVFLQLLTGFWVMHELERRLKLKITGTFWPLPLFPRFISNNAQFVWENKVTLLSGNVKIDYNLIPWFTKNSIRIKIQGRSIKAHLAGDWSKMQGVEQITVDTFEADVDVARNGLGEIYLVRAESPSFHFAVQRN